MKAINEFKQFEQLDPNPTKAREEMTENRISSKPKTRMYTTHYLGFWNYYDEIICKQGK